MLKYPIRNSMNVIYHLYNNRTKQNMWKRTVTSNKTVFVIMYSECVSCKIYSILQPTKMKYVMFKTYEPETPLNRCYKECEILCEMVYVTLNLQCTFKLKNRNVKCKNWCELIYVTSNLQRVVKLRHRKCQFDIHM